MATCRNVFVIFVQCLQADITGIMRYIMLLGGAVLRAEIL